MSDPRDALFPDLTQQGEGPFELLHNEVTSINLYDHGNDTIRPVTELCPMTEDEAIAVCAALNWCARRRAAPIQRPT